MISREMIISYLTEYSAIEEIFRTYYEQDGKVNSFYDMEKKYAFFMKEGSRFLQRKKELDEKYPKKILDLDNVDLDAWEKENVQKNMDHEIKEKNRVHFLHKEFFETDKNIFINKHIRFSPGEFHDHEFIEMCYIYRGKVDQFLRSKEGKAEKKETLNQGNLLIIPPIALIYYFRKYPRVKNPQGDLKGNLTREILRETSGRPQGRIIPVGAAPKNGEKETNKQIKELI